MWFKYCTLVIFSLVVFTGCGTSSTLNYTPSVCTDSSFNKKYSSDELRSDFLYLNKTLEEVHPDIYARTSKEKMISERGRILNLLSTPRTRLEFWNIITPYVAKFHEGHTQVELFIGEKKYLYSKWKIFPFSVKLNEPGDAIVTENLSNDSDIVPGTIITEINGIAVNKIRDSLMQYLSFERDIMKKISIDAFFRLYLTFVYKFHNEFTLTCKESNSPTLKYKKVDGVLGDTIISRLTKTVKTVPVNYSYKSLGNGIGLIDFRSFADIDAFQMFLDTTFKQIKAESVKDLIIDIRGNGGGNSELGDSLLTYITGKPFTQCSRMELKLSNQIYEQYKSMAPWYLKIAMFFGYNFSDADSISGGIAYINNVPQKPAYNQLLFSGNTYVLINGGTFSSATMFASTIKDCKLGTLIGEETGGLATITGDIYTFELPITKLKCGVSHKRFVRPSGEVDGKGVLPDYEIKLSAQINANGPDDVLEFTKELIQKNRNR